ncbi:MAG: hypothetical protein IJR38_03975 [Selenomonadaceae bacterium]|nr:hypothetical protein [Selenomonadaceae bacterium]
MRIKDFLTVLLATLVFATGLAGNRLASAAASAHRVTDVTGTVTRVEMENVDFNIYSRYNADVAAVSKDLVPAAVITKRLKYGTNPKRILLKAVPGQAIKFRITPESNTNMGAVRFLATYAGRYPFKITASSFSRVNDDHFEFNAYHSGTTFADGSYKLGLFAVYWEPPLYLVFRMM